MSDTRPRVLVFAGKSSRQHPVAENLCEHFQVDVFDDMAAAMNALRHETYHAVFADVGDFLPLERALVGDKPRPQHHRRRRLHRRRRRPMLLVQ
jgi:hypothetical protein